MATAKFVAEVPQQVSGSKLVSASWNIPSPILHTEVETLAAATDVLIRWPDNSSVCVIGFAANETATFIIKGDPADVGLTISTTNPIVLTKGSAANFRIRASILSQPVEFNFI